MKKLYYLVAAAMVTGAMFFFGTNRSEASSVVDELQRSNLEILSSESYYLETNCFDLVDTGNPNDKIFHKCTNGMTPWGNCHVAYTDKHQPMYFIPCYLVPKE